MSPAPFVSPGTRSDANELNATYLTTLLSPEIAGEPDGAFARDETATGSGPKMRPEAVAAITTSAIAVAARTACLVMRMVCLGKRL